MFEPYESVFMRWWCWLLFVVLAGLSLFFLHAAFKFAAQGEFAASIGIGIVSLLCFAIAFVTFKDLRGK